jgi:chromosome segregation ATPase
MGKQTNQERVQELEANIQRLETLPAYKLLFDWQVQERDAGLYESRRQLEVIRQHQNERNSNLQPRLERKLSKARAKLSRLRFSMDQLRASEAKHKSQVEQLELQLAKLKPQVP